MAISDANVIALRTFPPSILHEPYIDFFEYLSDNAKQIMQDPIIDKTKLLDIFLDYCKEGSSKKEFENKKDEIKKGYHYLTKKLHSIPFLRDDGQFISEIKWDKLIEFYKLLKHIKKSDERKIRWAIFNLFSSGKKKILLKELENSLSKLQISNLEKMVNKIIQESSSDGMKIMLKEDVIIIDHDLNDENVIHNLIEHVEYISRRSRGELEQQILDTLDKGSYSNQEIAEICDADKSMVSKTMNQLEKIDKTIVYSSGGPRGIRYYTTNCDNCPWGFEKLECRKDATGYIKRRVLDRFGVKLSDRDFDEIKTNQAVLRMKDMFMFTRSEQKIELENNLSENLQKLFSTIIMDSIKKSSKKSKKIRYVSLVSVLSKMPVLYSLGYFEGSRNGMNTMDVILGHALKSLPKDQKEKIKKDIMQEFNNYLKIVSNR